MRDGKIVAAVWYQDAVYIFTELGVVFRMWIDHTRQPQFEQVYRFN